MKKVTVKVLAKNDVQLPGYSSLEAAGADVRAYLSEETVIEPGRSKLIPTGLKVEIPEGYEMQLRPRSGLAYKNQITLLNTPGTVDSDYRGEIRIILINHSHTPFVVTPNMRIAQMVLTPVVQAEFVLSKELMVTTRGEGGFGHTGMH